MPVIILLFGAFATLQLLVYKGENGEVYSPTYLKTIHAQLSAIFNHAIRYYHLLSNPAKKVGSMGSEEHKEMLYWYGICMGELLALTPKNFDFDKQTLTVNKFFQRLNGRDVITRHYLHHEMDRGAKLAGVKRIRIEMYCIKRRTERGKMIEKYIM